MSAMFSNPFSASFDAPALAEATPLSTSGKLVNRRLSTFAVSTCPDHNDRSLFPHNVVVEENEDGPWISEEAERELCLQYHAFLSKGDLQEDAREKVMQQIADAYMLAHPDREDDEEEGENTEEPEEIKRLEVDSDEQPPSLFDLLQEMKITQTEFENMTVEAAIDIMAKLMLMKAEQMVESRLPDFDAYSDMEPGVYGSDDESESEMSTQSGSLYQRRSLDETGEAKKPQKGDRWLLDLFGGSHTAEPEQEDGMDVDEVVA